MLILSRLSAGSVSRENILIEMHITLSQPIERMMSQQTDELRSV
jgi:hypothetical protein